VIVVICASSIVARENALFRDQVIQFELTEFNVQPGGTQKIVEPHIQLYQCCAAAIDEWLHSERDIFVERACRDNINTAYVESRLVTSLSTSPLVGSPGTLSPPPGFVARDATAVSRAS
jgi:hypothetical protein